MNSSFKFEPQEYLLNHLPEFIKRRDEDLISIQKYMAVNNMQKIEDICHRIYGVASSYGMSPLGEMAKEVSNFSKLSDQTGINTVLGQMYDYIAFAKKQLSID